MILLKVLSLLLLPFLIYPIRKITRRSDINFFDLMIIFHCLYFVIIPLTLDEEIITKKLGTIDNTVVIFIFSFLLILFSLFTICSLRIKKNSLSLLNITRHIKKFPEIETHFIFKLILLVIPVLSLIIYVPAVSYLSFFNEYNLIDRVSNYEESVWIRLLGNAFYISLYITILLFFQNLQRGKKNILNLLTIVLCIINFLLLPRRLLLTIVLLFLLFLYSLMRKHINKRLIFNFLIVIIFIALVYFPFYNTIRFSENINFSPSNPIKSITQLYDYGKSNINRSKQIKEQSNRSLNLYSALYFLIKYDQTPSFGRLTYLAIDHAIPEFINPNKGLGSEPILEKRTRQNMDIADSVILLSAGDFSILGPLYSILIFYFIYFVALLICRIFNFFFHLSTITSLWCVIFLFTQCFNIEVKLDAILANFISIMPILIILSLFQKFNLISLKR